MGKTKIAIHPQTLDIRVDKPGMRLKDRGYFVFTNEEQLATWPQLDRLIEKLSGKPRKKYGSSLGAVTRIWPDLVLRAVNNIGAIVEEQAVTGAGIDIEKEIDPEAERKRKLGRGNHNVRIPNFKLTGIAPEIPVPPQAEILAQEFNKLYTSGRRDVANTEIKELVMGMNLPTQQDPMRIFRYYFWLLVNAKTFSVDGEVRRDVVTRQNAIRHKLVPQ